MSKINIVLILPNSLLRVSNVIFVNTLNHYGPFSKNSIILFVVPPRVCINIFVFQFLLGLTILLPQEKIIKTMLMQNFEGTMKSIMVFLKRAISLIYKKKMKIMHF